jgi:glutathione peroxidase-family protein
MIRFSKNDKKILQNLIAAEALLSSAAEELRLIDNPKKKESMAHLEQWISMQVACLCKINDKAQCNFRNSYANGKELWNTYIDDVLLFLDVACGQIPEVNEIIKQKLRR